MRFRICLFLLAIAFNSRAQEVSPTAQFSILTVGPSEELYTSFGHTALRMKDSIQGTDIVFNWGVFDFHTPNFYLKFAGGRLNYMLAAESFDSFMADIYYRQSKVVEQVLNLSEAEKEKLYSLIFENYKPENRYYKYDFFYDNCASRVRDIVLAAINHQYDLHEDQAQKKPTFRILCGTYLYNKPWTRLGIDILLGMPADKEAGMFDAMFLPNNLYIAFKQISREDKTPIVLKENQITVFSGTIGGKDDWSPLYIFIAFSVLSVLVVIFFKKLRRILDGFLFTAVGLVGLLILAMWFFSDHKVMVNNLNVLWAVPIHVFYFVILRFRRFAKMYFTVTGFLALAVIVLIPVLPQTINICLIPIIVLLMLRSFSEAFHWDDRMHAYLIKNK